MQTLLKVLALSFLIDASIAVPQRCAQAERWSIQGRAFVDEYKGKVLLLAFMRLDCPTCETSVRSLNEFMKTETLQNRNQQNVVKIVVVVPHNELDSHIRSLQVRYNLIRIVKETPKEPLWGWLRVGHNDVLLYDRCGRLARHLRLPQQDVTHSRAHFEAIKSVITSQPCGPCQYDRESLSNAAARPQITAYVRQSAPQPPPTPSYRNNNGPPQAQRNQGSFNSKEWVRVPSISSSSRNRQATTTTTTTPTPPIEQLYSDVEPEIATTSATNKGASSDTDSYYDYITDLGTTTKSPQNVQIPKPTTASPLWPTKGPIFDGKFNPSCAGYTDEICFNQYTQLSKTEIHKCCRNRVSLTDQCQPGKCSNATQQLCCIQKFLQAKLSCCNDESQTSPTGSTDKFSRCCYENFVTENDECCAKTYASTQWKAVHELCLPNVKVDLSEIRIKTVVPGTNVPTDFDFRSHRRWEFECKYGGHVSQYSYFGAADSETT